MGYDEYFENALAQLRGERRYRVFADLERLAGRFRMQSGIPPRARAT